MFIHIAKEDSAQFLYQHCDELKKGFLELKEPRDIAQLLEVSYKRLIYHTLIVPERLRYVVFPISKKSGQPRTISAPCTSIKIIQRKLSQVLYSVYEPKASVHGFVAARSILTNAQQHANKRFILNIDLKDFFHSIEFKRVRGIFVNPPYKLPQEVAIVLARICCHSGRLPQGAPTSPIISNMICARMDSELRKLAKECQCTYTRYADDITFSTTLKEFPNALACVESPTLESYGLNTENLIEKDVNDALPEKICHEIDSSIASKVFLGERLKAIIEKNGFEINQNKVRLQNNKQHQEVTGLTVNKFPNVKRNFVREISSMLYIWHRYGLKSAEDRYFAKYNKSLEESEYQPPKFKQVPSFKQVLRGKINFLGMIKGKDHKTYLTYSKWFHELSARDLSSTSSL
jgi:RNA-directed DNA polymerase